MWHIKSILNFVKDQALRVFSSTSKALWKMSVKNMGISLCAFMLYGTISSPYDYTDPFLSISATVFHIKAYVSTSPSGNVRAYGIGVSSSKFGFTPLSGTLYYMVPPKIVQNIIGSISTLFSRVKRISALA